VSINHVRGRAGGFAQRRFNHRRRAWRLRFWWTFPLVAVLPIAIELPIALFTHAPHRGFWTGLGLGAGLAAALVLFDSPPAHVERWRSGADGEKSTARTLRPLLSRGWTLFNDIPTGHGNIDHVLVGPPGIFMLESKRLAGRARVEASGLVIRWHEDPDDGYENDSIAGRARGAAFELHSRIDWPGASPWVQAVVVLWAAFDQRPVERDKVAWVRGDQLVAVLGERPIRFTGDVLRRLTSQTGKAVAKLRRDNQASSPPH